MDYDECKVDAAVLTIILLGGVVLTGITLSLFSLIDVKIEKWYMDNIVVMDLADSPIVAANIADSKNWQ